jgi:hypothetical protein
VKFEARIKELVDDVPELAVLIEPLRVVRWVIREQISVLHRRLSAIVRDDEVCRPHSLLFAEIGSHPVGVFVGSEGAKKLRY